MTELVYPAVLAPEPSGGFVVSFPDVPGALTQGDTIDEAVCNARIALELVLEAIEEAGDPLPNATPLTGLIPPAGALTTAVIATLDTAVERVNVSFPRALLQRVDAVADRRGQTRSGFLAAAARRALEEDA